jgi:hypothetical protein
MTTIVASGYLRLKAAELLREHNTNLHQASQKGGFSYPTMHRYIKQPESIESMHMRSIVGLLVDGLGLSPDEIENLRFGDIFEVVLENKNGENGG